MNFNVRMDGYTRWRVPYAKHLVGVCNGLVNDAPRVADERTAKPDGHGVRRGVRQHDGGNYRTNRRWRERLCAYHALSGDEGYAAAAGRNCVSKYDGLQCLHCMQRVCIELHKHCEASCLRRCVAFELCFHVGGDAPGFVSAECSPSSRLVSTWYRYR